VRKRILTSAAIGFATAAYCWFLLVHAHQGSADFTWAMRAARYMLARQNPYNTPLEQYPFTGAIFAVPFLWLRPEVAAAAFYGCGAALLAFGVTRTGYYRLLVFLAYPFWAGMFTAQWAPLITAAAFFPILLPVVMAKPQVGLPVALTHLSRTGVIACLVVVGLTLIALPQWPLLWLHQLGNYEHFIPILILPGPLLALALIRYKDKDAWLLFLAAIMPQRWFFDSFTLWLIPKTRRELLFTGVISWGTGLWRWFHAPRTFAEVGLWTVVFIYMPMLGLILSRVLVPPEESIQLPGS
jgi:hypothetical protein